jgi:predicted DNA-binding transcriptional regulator YafY
VTTTDTTKPGRPAKTYSQAHRLLILYDMLNDGAHLRAKHTAEKFGVSRRTLERDISVLREVLPLERIESPEVAYRLVGRKRRWELSSWQVLAVAVGAKTTDFLAGRRFAPELEPLLDQLRSALNPGQRHRLYGVEQKIHAVRLGDKDYRTRPDLQEVLVEMTDGLLYEKHVDVLYLSHRRAAADKDPLGLSIHPLSLILHRGGVYFICDVVGGDWHGDDRRILLALDRIKRAECQRTDDSFDYPTDFNSDEFLADAFGIATVGEIERVQLHIDEVYAPYVLERHWHESQSFEHQLDGSIVMSLEVCGYWELVDWILGMGEHVEALEPPALRKQVRERLEMALAKYASDSPAT